MSSATMTSKGQATVPKDVRERLGLGRGERLPLRLDPQGEHRVHPESAPALGRLPGLLRHLKPLQPVSVERMRQGILERTKPHEKHIARVE